MTVYTGEICTACVRPIVVDEKAPQVARCRKCGASYHTQCWFSAGEKCIRAGCDGKASDIGPPKVKEPVGEICPFLPPETPRREGAELIPAKCLKARCAIYDSVEGRCGLGQIAYVMATARQAGQESRNTLSLAVGNSSRQVVQLLTNLATAFRGTETQVKAFAGPQERANKAVESIAALVGEVKQVLQALA
ncbi:MAG: hypothetical protein ACREID_05905, partial [Planctomycetota bacterium]